MIKLIFVYFCLFLITFIYIYYKNRKIKKVRQSIAVFFSKIFNDEESWFKKFDFFLRMIQAILVTLFIQRFFIGNFTIPTKSMYPTFKVGDKLFGDMFIFKFTQIKRFDIISFYDEFKEIEICKRVIGLPGETISIHNKKVFINNKPLSNEITYYQNSSEKKSLLSNDVWKIPRKNDKIKMLSGTFSLEINDEIKTLNMSQLKNLIIHNKKINNIKIESVLCILNDNEITGPILLDKKFFFDLICEKEIILKEDYYMVLGDNSKNSEDSRFIGFISKSMINSKMIIKWLPIEEIGIIK